MAQINIYNTSFTARRLRDSLMGEIEVGDADQLHNACIVLCDLVDRLDSRIAKLEQHPAVEEHTDGYNEYMEKRKRWEEQVEENRRLS